MIFWRCLAVYSYQMARAVQDCRTDYARGLEHWAKVELLTEKVKKRLVECFGEKLDKMADLVVAVVVESQKSEGGLARKQGELSDAFESLTDND